MNQDYLWDKTGDDSEIKELENALHAFRSNETIAPSLPPQIIVVEKQPSRKFFQWGFAFATCASIAFVSIGFWFQITRNPDIVKNLPPKTSVQNSAPSKTEAIIEATVEQQGNLVSTPSSKPTRKKSNTTNKKRRRNTKRLRKVGSRKNRSRNTMPKVVLTKEERYAYEQLMLGLSITSSKLKIVRDKARGVQEKPSIIKDGR